MATTPKRPRDPNQLAKMIVELSTGEAQPKPPAGMPPDYKWPSFSSAPISPVPIKNEAAVALGRLGGLKGGKARAESMTPEKRKEIAQKAAAKRWGKDKE